MKTLTTSDRREFLRALRRAWSIETSPQWLPHDPARGQGPVTALVFHDRFGGEILKTPVGDGWHFYNRVAGTVCDFAAEQFSELPAYLHIPSSRDEALAGSAPERYQALAGRISEALASNRDIRDGTDLICPQFRSARLPASHPPEVLMRRIGLAVVFFVGLLLAPHLAEAQPQAKLWRIGWLSAFSAPEEMRWREAFRQGLQENGYTEGLNVVVESRWADGQYDRLTGLTMDLVRQQVDVIVAATTTPAQAAKKSTATIPIVFLIIADPVAQGLVTSLARPGGNATGLASTAGPEIYGKMLELLKEAVPGLTRVALLWNPASPFGALFVREVGSAARSLGLHVKAIEGRRPEEFENAFGAAVRERAGGLVVTPDPMFIANRARLADLAARSRLPAVYGVRQHAEAGGLMVYTADFTDLYRRAGGYVARILKGAKPGDLPVEQPTKFELVINLKTAKALGLTIPQSVLLRADEIIQ